jgi:hypothetical protein
MRAAALGSAGLTIRCARPAWAQKDPSERRGSSRAGMGVTASSNMLAFSDAPLLTTHSPRRTEPRFGSVIQLRPPATCVGGRREGGHQVGLGYPVSEALCRTKAQNARAALA